MKMITNEDDDESEDNLNSHLPSMKQVPGSNDLILLLHITIIKTMFKKTMVLIIDFNNTLENTN